MTKIDPVVHFEMPYENNDRVISFYNRVFGWQMYQYGKNMGEYILATTTELDENHMPLRPGSIGGGFYQKSPEMPKCPSIVIAVEDIRTAMEKVTHEGGAILGEPAEIPGIGLYVAITDTEGNRVGILEPYNR